MSQFGSVTTAPFVAAIRPGALFAALIASAIALAGCARQDQQQAHAAAVAAPPPPAYCQPSPSPDCGFRGSSMLRTMDPGEFTRLKHDYERRCIRRAERTDRARLRQLQTAGVCPA